MQIDTAELKKMSEDVELPEGFFEVPGELSGDAKEVLGEKSETVVKRDSQAGRNLLAWAKNKRNRRKRARKARKKSRG